MHDYKVPNNPDANEWNNLCLEDIGIFWDLPNFDEAKFYYFQAVQVKGENPSNSIIPSPVVADSVDEICDNHYKWRWNESTNMALYRTFGFVSGLSFTLAYMAF